MSDNDSFDCGDCGGDVNSGRNLTNNSNSDGFCACLDICFLCLSCQELCTNCSCSCEHQDEKDRFGKVPKEICCQWCNRQVVTQVESKAGTGTFCLSAILCLVGCIPCFWIPCCSPYYQDATHYCPNCQREVGESKFW